MEENPERSVKLHVIAKQTENEYSVREFSSIKDFFLEVIVKIPGIFPSQYQIQPANAIQEIVSRLSDLDMELK